MRTTDVIIKEIIRELDGYMKKYPNTYNAVKRLLWELKENVKKGLN